MGAIISKINHATKRSKMITTVLSVLVTFLVVMSFGNLAQAQFNTPPTAVAGADISANEGTFILLDGTLSNDPDGDPITFSWTQIAGPAALSITGANTATPTVQLPFVSAGGATLTFQLTVTDIYGDSTSDSVNVSVVDVNAAPVASIIAPATVVEGANITLDGSGSYDPNSDAITFAWSQTAGPSASLNLADPSKPTLVAPIIGSAYTLQFQLIVSDGSLSSVPVTVDIAVSLANQTPLANAGANQTAIYGDTVTLNGSGSSDPDGDALTYSWSQISGAAVSLDLTDPVHPTFVAPSVSGNLVFNLVVNDGQLNSAASSVTVTVNAPVDIPNCANARANRTQLWPPNHKLARVKIRGIEVRRGHFGHHEDRDDDRDDDADDDDEDLGKVVIRITGVTQDEPTTGTGHGDTGPDAVFSSSRNYDHDRVKDLVLLRKERSSSGDGRIYEISFTATNTVSNGSCTGKIKVCVPTQRGKKGKCTDSGQAYNSSL